MLTKQQRVRVNHQRFIRLMDFYEQNYLSLRKLIPDLDNASGHLVSVKRNAIDLHMQIIEKEKYTTTLLLTHYFNKGQQRVAKPNLILRVYHDARNVEVLSAQLNNEKLQLAQQAVKSQLRYQLNRFLYKWLQYLLKQGHNLRKPIKASSLLHNTKEKV